MRLAPRPSFARPRPGFNSRTPGGVRLSLSKLTLLQTLSFNSRTPGGVRPVYTLASSLAIMFQFTHPGRGATCVLSGLRATWSFQFTHPGRGATCFKECHNREYTVSIHAPREGCDDAPFGTTGAMLCFNSRTPGGVRPLDLRGCSFVLTFQFTHPGRGATQKRKNADKKHGCFNSRTPGGVRLNDTEEIERGDTSFNSRTPGGVRLVNIRSRDRAITFQFTHPGRGATIDGWSSNINISVSIHAPREGCD